MRRLIILVVLACLASPVAAQEFIPILDDEQVNPKFSVPARGCTRAEQSGCQIACENEGPPWHNGGNWFLSVQCVGWIGGGATCRCNWWEAPDGMAMFLPGASRYYTLKRA